MPQGRPGAGTPAARTGGGTRRVVADCDRRGVPCGDGRGDGSGPQFYRALGAREASGAGTAARSSGAAHASRSDRRPVTRGPRAHGGRGAPHRCVGTSAGAGRHRSPGRRRQGGIGQRPAVAPSFRHPPEGGPQGQEPEHAVAEDPRPEPYGRRGRVRHSPPRAGATSNRTAGSTASGAHSAPRRTTSHTPARSRPDSGRAANGQRAEPDWGLSGTGSCDVRPVVPSPGRCARPRLAARRLRPTGRGCLSRRVDQPSPPAGYRRLAPGQVDRRHLSR